MEQYTVGSLTKKNLLSKELEFKFGQMVQNMRVTGKIIKLTELGGLY